MTLAMHPADTDRITIPISGVPEDEAPLDVSFDDGATWHQTEWNTNRSGLLILVTGPDGTGDGAPLTLRHNRVLVRLGDPPLQIHRPAPEDIYVA